MSKHRMKDWRSTKDPSELIDPMACRNCGHTHGGWRYAYHYGSHEWERPTERQIKYRMIRRRRHHADTRWLNSDRRTSYRKWLLLDE